MPNTESDNISDSLDTSMTLEAAQRVEQEKLTRRAALRKLGFGAGIAAFSLLGVDDFARMVGQRLQRNAYDNKTALAVAKEFQSAGIALAAGPSAPCASIDGKCQGNDCLSGMPLCGCGCTQGPRCQECCDTNCKSTVGYPADPHSSCYGSCME